jgi:hypothetical protein
MQAVWRIQYGEHGWVREVHTGSPIITGSFDEAWMWATRAEAEQALAALPSSPLKRRVVPGSPSERRPYYTP